MKKTRILFWIVLQVVMLSLASGQSDTLRVMAYNVLYYGDRPPCQGPHQSYHKYLETIIRYANPDLVSLEKMAAIPNYKGDPSGVAPLGFADSVKTMVMDQAYPGKYEYAPFTNNAAADNVNLLFYNKIKLGFLGIVSNYVNVTDFNTYKFFYRDSLLKQNHDTIFLFLTTNHTVSGTSASNIAARNSQVMGQFNQIKSVFNVLPNYISMGDFNVHNSNEAGYLSLTQISDTNFILYDPPFYPDAKYNYPADWDQFPNLYASHLTTSTRQSSKIPNSCGTSGGAKSWYDHILFSRAIAQNLSGIKYIPNSFKVIGNDGRRKGISVNDPSIPNYSVPSNVLEAIFQMSNKYPIMATFEVKKQVVSGFFPSISDQKLSVRIVNPASDALEIGFSEPDWGRRYSCHIYDMTGKEVLNYENQTSQANETLFWSVQAGMYLIRIQLEDGNSCNRLIVKCLR